MAAKPAKNDGFTEIQKVSYPSRRRLIAPGRIGSSPWMLGGSSLLGSREAFAQLGIFGNYNQRCHFFFCWFFCQYAISFSRSATEVPVLSQ